MARCVKSTTVHNISSLYTMDSNVGEGELGLLRNAAIAFEGEQVVYVGPTEGAPQSEEMISGEGMVGVPGLVDCHTHTVYAGSRADEFGRRLAGATYSEILEQGGGILSTVRSTREASEEHLTSLARARVYRMLKKGVTTVEIKSGYGLTPQDELKMLKSAKNCSDIVNIKTTFLGAHTTPAEFRQDQAAYVNQVINEQLPLAAPYADAIDVFCDKGAFTLEEGIRILTAGKEHGLKIKAHSEQIIHTGISRAAAKLGAMSVDHLERLTDEDILSMKEAGTVAVVLPGAQVYLKDTSPPVEKLRAAGVPIAVATDLNPGSSPVHDLWTCATLSCIVQGLTMNEALLGITKYAGQALGEPTLGWLGVGSAADMSLQLPPPGEEPIMQSLIQHISGHDTPLVIRGGVRVV